MRAFAILVIALIGLVNCQQTGNGRRYNDRGQQVGGSSRQQLNPGQGVYGNAPLGGQGASNTNGVHHANVGNGPVGQGGSSGGFVDVAPVVNSGPSLNNVNHQNAGAQPQAGQGGSSNGLSDIPLGPVQTGQNNRVNMNNQGAAPVAGQGNSPNSGEYVYDYGVGGAVQGNGAAVNGQTGDMQPNAPQVAWGEAVVGQGAGGNSNNGGNAYNGGQYNDNAARGGAEISDLTQKEAGKAAHSSGVAGVGTATAGVVVAVLVLVGIVAVAAVFLIRQRRSRMNSQV